MSLNTAIEIDSLATSQSPDFTICTLVTNKQQYSDMLESFNEAGFYKDRCEYIYIDNSTRNKFDAYDGLNILLQAAKGKYIILCHQDLLLHDHRIDRLDVIISEMNELDENWAVLGNAGGIVPGKKAIRITDPFYGEDAKVGTFPARVFSLDENFMLVKRSSNLALSRDIGGFHMYGTDLCLIADILGFSTYVVDFHLHHIGGEAVKDLARSAIQTPTSFNSVKRRFVNKYQRAFRARWLQTTCTILYISRSRIGILFGNWKFVRSVAKRAYRLLG